MSVLRIASFNLENLGDTPEFPLGPRLPVLRPQLERLAADVLCLQEVNASRLPGAGERSHHALEKLVQGTRYQDFEIASTHGEKGEGPRDVHNLVVMSRFPVLEVNQYHNTLVPVLDVPMAEGVGTGKALKARFDRPFLHVVLELEGGRPLHVINVHLRAPSGSFIPGEKAGAWEWKSVPGWAEAFYLSSVKRSGQALEVRLVVDRILDADPEALILVCGDFNAEDLEAPMRIVMAGDEDTGNGNLAWRSLVSLERSLPEERAFTVVHHGRRQMLDHMLVSRRLFGTFRIVEVHNEALGDELVAYEKVSHPPESFHAPLVAAFEVGL